MCPKNLKCPKLNLTLICYQDLNHSSFNFFYFSDPVKSETWTQLSLPESVNSLKSISSGGLGTWGLGDGGQVLQYKDDGWEVTSTQSLEQISVGKDVLWGVSSDGGVWKGEYSSGSMKWSKVDGNLKQISASDNDHVWGCLLYTSPSPRD